MTAKHLHLSLAILILGTLTALSACVSPPSKPSSETDNHSTQLKRASSQWVVMEQSEPAFIVFTGIPENLESAKLDAIKQQVAAHENASLLTWQEFVTHIRSYARSVMLRNDYPNTRTLDGLICLVGSKQGAGAPWGLTWNGGIALTFNDYQHARKSYADYRQNPKNYRPIIDSRNDPVHPDGHLPFAGCD